MKKILLFGLVTIMSVSSANAGWFSDLFGKKEAEPATLGEACDINKVTAVCPEIILGQKTLLECVTENVKTVSQTCVDYVKKAVAENSPEITNLTEKIKTTSAAATDAVKTEAAATSDEIKQQAAEKINAAKLEIAKKLVESTNAETK